MFTRSHLQELKRRYASIYAPPVEEKVIEDGTDEGVNQYKKDTPGQDIEKEFKEHCGVCGEQGIEEDEIDESLALQLKMAFGDAKIKMKSKKGKIVIAKRDKNKAMDVLTKTLPSKLKKYVDKAVGNFLVFEEVEIEEAKKPTRDAGMECMECGKKFRAKLSTLQYGRTKCPKCKSTDLDFAFGESVKEEVELVEKGVAYPPTIDNLRMIVKDKQHQTFMFKSGKAMVDLFTASAMVQVYDALKKPEMKKTFEKMIKDKAGFMKTQAFAMKMIGK